MKFPSTSPRPVVREKPKRVPQWRRDVEILKATLPEGPPPVARPVMVVISGLPGSGKSHFSRRLAEQVGLLTLESDVLRTGLFPSPRYTSLESRRLFRACHVLIDDLLGRGIPVLLDATNLVEANREQLYHIADRRGIGLILVYLRAPAEVVRERLIRRSQRADSEDRSGAGWEVYRRLYHTVEPIKRDHFMVDTSRDISPALVKLAREIRRWTGTPG